MKKQRAHNVFAFPLLTELQLGLEHIVIEDFEARFWV